ncbi:MAG: ATP-binding protein [Vicinamibacterales bacterium]
MRLFPKMNIATNLNGRLRNTSLPQSHGLLPLFEAVINSIHGIEEAGIPPDYGRIRITIERETTLFDDDRKSGGQFVPEILAFTVTDNGVGFNAENFDAFLTLDTEHKVAKGGRGIGRLLWLKAFSRVEVVSTFEDGDALALRTFEFSTNGVTAEDVATPPAGATRETTVRLVEFDPKFRAKSRKTADGIANALIEHCLWYFVRPGSCPAMTLEDDGEALDLHEVFERHMHTQAVRQVLQLKGRPFELLHVKLRTSAATEHAIAYCANNRLVDDEKLEGRIPGLHRSLRDGEGEFVYVCYVSSPLLDERVRPERSAFDLPTTEVEGLFDGTDISWSDIRNLVVGEAAKHLENYLVGVKERARERVTRFVSEKAPRYRPILRRIAPDALNIDPDINDKDLELTLHRHFAELERQLLDEGHELLTPRLNESTTDYKARIADYMRKVEDVKMSDLVGYVAHRRVVIELLAQAIKRGADGKYAREDLIHTLIMPMRVDSADVMLDNCNLWLVDERLAFHNYLASDQTLAKMPITGSTSTKEPDLLALNVFDNPVLMSETKTPPFASLVVIELKRPMRDDDSDPVEQALNYLRLIRRGRVTTAEGRPIPDPDDIPGYCYVICDLTEPIQEACKFRHDLQITSDRMGFFGYMRNMKAYVEVNSFDRMVNQAKERNRAFFDKLGLPAF